MARNKAGKFGANRGQQIKIARAEGEMPDLAHMKGGTAVMKEVTWLPECQNFAGNLTKLHQQFQLNEILHQHSRNSCINNYKNILPVEIHFLSPPSEHSPSTHFTLLSLLTRPRAREPVCNLLTIT